MKIASLLFLLFALPSWLLAADARLYEEFIQKVRTCCERNDLAGLKKLYYFEGTPDVIVDQEIHGWEHTLAELQAGKAEYFGAEHHELKDYLKRPDVAADLKFYESIYRPVVMNGTVYAPNLEVVGIVAVRFRVGPSIAGGLKPVGIAPDGSMRFVTRKIEKPGRAPAKSSRK